MKTNTQTLAAALRQLASDIESPDGVANAAILEAAERLEELTAQVEVLRSALKLAQESARSDYKQGYLKYGDYNKIELALIETPTQCLREIQAEAGRAGFIAGAESMKLVFQYGGNYNTQDKANQYANCIRKGGE